MASIHITIDTDGAAFHESAANPYEAVGLEVARILRVIADDFNMNYTNHNVPAPCDFKGNPCGTVEIID